jgi:hypothetical protein
MGKLLTGIFSIRYFMSSVGLAYPNTLLPLNMFFIYREEFVFPLTIFLSNIEPETTLSEAYIRL